MDLLHLTQEEHRCWNSLWSTFLEQGHLFQSYSTILLVYNETWAGLGYHVETMILSSHCLENL